MKIKRNDKCQCGSGKKVKRCCIKTIEQLRARVEAGEDPQAIMVQRILGK